MLLNHLLIRGQQRAHLFPTLPCTAQPRWGIARLNSSLCCVSRGCRSVGRCPLGSERRCPCSTLGGHTRPLAPCTAWRTGWTAVRQAEQMWCQWRNNCSLYLGASRATDTLPCNPGSTLLGHTELLWWNYRSWHHSMRLCIPTEYRGTGLYVISPHI